MSFISYAVGEKSVFPRNLPGGCDTQRLKHTHRVHWNCDFGNTHTHTHTHTPCIWMNNITSCLENAWWLDSRPENPNRSIREEGQGDGMTTSGQNQWLEQPTRHFGWWALRIPTFSPPDCWRGWLHYSFCMGRFSGLSKTHRGNGKKKTPELLTV